VEKSVSSWLPARVSNSPNWLGSACSPSEQGLKVTFLEGYSRSRRSHIWQSQLIQSSSSSKSVVDQNQSCFLEFVSGGLIELWPWCAQISALSLQKPYFLLALVTTAHNLLRSFLTTKYFPVSSCGICLIRKYWFQNEIPSWSTSYNAASG
jgi:hypothetical protein